MKTSLTTSTVSRFIKDAANNDQLGCRIIKGFHLKRMARGGVYRFRYTDATGKRRTAKIGDAPALKPQQAAEIALEWSLKLQKGETDPLTEKRQAASELQAQEQKAANRKYHSLGAFYSEIYCKVLTDSPAVLEKIRIAFSHLFDRDMESLTAQDLDNWYFKSREERLGKDGEKKAPLKRTTLVGYFGALKAMLNYAAGQRRDIRNPNPILENNPLLGYTLPRLSKKEREEANDDASTQLAQRDIFSEDTKAAIQTGLDVYAEELREKRRKSRKHGKAYLPDLDDLTFPHWFIPFTKIAWLTGMRPGDIYSLKWENIDFNPFTGKCTLVYTPLKTMHKGDNPIQVRFPFGKEHPFIDIVKAWNDQLGNPTTGLLFKSTRTGRALERKSHLKHWTHVKDLGGVPEQLQFYSFRHNFISDLVRKGVPPEQIRKLVGHADTTMISRNYMRTDDQDMESLAQLSAQGWQSPSDKQNSENRRAYGE